MVGRYLDGERPPAALDGGLAAAWARAWGSYTEKIGEYLLHDALAALWEFVGEANRFVDREQPWALAKQAKAGDAQAADRLRAALGDLVEACRVISLAAAPFMPDAAHRVQGQLGFEYPYAADGNCCPPLAAQAAWGASMSSGRIGDMEILFPRVEIGDS